MVAVEALVALFLVLLPVVVAAAVRPEQEVLALPLVEPEDCQHLLAQEWQETELQALSQYQQLTTVIGAAAAVPVLPQLRSPHPWADHRTVVEAAAGPVDHTRQPLQLSLVALVDDLALTVLVVVEQLVLMVLLLLRVQQVLPQPLLREALAAAVEEPQLPLQPLVALVAQAGPVEAAVAAVASA